MVNPKDIPHDCRCEVCGAELSKAVDGLKKLHADDLKWAIEKNARLIVALKQIYKLEGPGPDGSSENASGRIARLALEG